MACAPVKALDIGQLAGKTALGSRACISDVTPQAEASLRLDTGGPDHLPHLSVSTAMSLPRSTGERTSAALPNSASRTLILRSRRAADRGSPLLRFCAMQRNFAAAGLRMPPKPFGTASAGASQARLAGRV